MTRRDRLYGLDRRTGKNLFEGEDPKTKLQTVGVGLNSVPSAAPVANEFMLYMPMGAKVAVLDLGLDKSGGAPRRPSKRSPGQPPYEGGARPGKRESAWLFDMPTDGPKIEQPLRPGPLLAAVSPTADFLAMHGIVARKPLVFKTERPVAAAMGQFEKIAYLASEDTNVYALNMESCAQVWRFTADAPIFRKPEVTTGTFRYRRCAWACTGWTAKPACAVAQSRRAAVPGGESGIRLRHRFGRPAAGAGLHGRGTTIAAYDLRDFTVPYSNELTDRIYLGSEDGLLVCMHLRDQVTPLTIPRACQTQGEAQAQGRAQGQRRQEARGQRQGRQESR